MMEMLITLISVALGSSGLSAIIVAILNHLFMSPEIPIYTGRIQDDYPTPVFLLSTYELDLTHNVFNPAEGAAMQCFNGAEANKRIAYFDGAPAIWWTRSMHTTILISRGTCPQRGA